jgi:RNA polymerase sigma factor (sigma-70 family)
MDPHFPAADSEQFAETLLRDIGHAMHQACRRHRSQLGPDEIEDLGQQIFLWLRENDYHRLRLFDEQKALFETWLQAVVEHYVGRYLQGLGRTQSLEDIALSSLILPPTQEADVLFEERRALLQKVACKLSKRQQQMLELLRRGGLTDVERARLIGVKPASFRVLKHALIKKLQRLIGGEIYPGMGFEKSEKICGARLTFSLGMSIKHVGRQFVSHQQ